MIEAPMADLLLGLRSHVEHASTWPGGWVRWSGLFPWRVNLLLGVGFLTAGNRDGEVHITNEGRQFLLEHS